MYATPGLQQNVQPLKGFVIIITVALNRGLTVLHVRDSICIASYMHLHLYRQTLQLHLGDVLILRCTENFVSDIVQQVCVIIRGARGWPWDSSLLVCLLPEARMGGHGYSSLLVCLFVCLFVTGISTHMGTTALRLQRG